MTMTSVHCRMVDHLAGQKAKRECNPLHRHDLNDHGGNPQRYKTRILGRAKNRKEEKLIEEKQQAAVNIGKAAWDKVFTEESFDLPPTRFMEKVKAAVSEADFQYIKKEILNTVKDEKD